VNRGARISAPASDELTDAVRWYEAQRPGLGAELFDAVVATIDGIERRPEIGAAAYADPETRRVLVERFPYQVVYRFEMNQIVILAVAHLKRRPGYWQHRS
jgi:plasmid stabilization system protein ParE